MFTELEREPRVRPVNMDRDSSVNTNHDTFGNSKWGNAHTSVFRQNSCICKSFVQPGKAVWLTETVVYTSVLSAPCCFPLGLRNPGCGGDQSIKQSIEEDVLEKSAKALENGAPEGPTIDKQIQQSTPGNNIETRWGVNNNNNNNNNNNKIGRASCRERV